MSVSFSSSQGAAAGASPGQGDRGYPEERDGRLPREKGAPGAEHFSSQK